MTKVRQRLINTYLELVKPHLHKSGFIKSSPFPPWDEKRVKEYLQIYIPEVVQPEDEDEEKVEFSVEVDGFVLKEISAFTDEGIIADAYGGGCSTLDFEDLPVEDLRLLVKTMRKNLPTKEITHE